MTITWATTWASWALALPLLGAPPETEGPEQVLERMASAYERLEGLEAKLTQTASYPQLGLTDPPEEGFLQVEKRDGGVDVRLELTSPERRVLVVKDGSYIFYQPRIKQAIVGKAGDAPGGGQATRAGRSLMLLLGDASQVEDEFEAELIDHRVALGDRHAAHLRLVPKDPSASYFRSIEIWVDEEIGLPISQLLVEPNGDEMRIRLDALRLNDPERRYDFELDLPDDVERIRGGP